MFSKPCKYAIRATLLLGRESSAGSKIGVTQIAEKLNLPKHYLAKILQQLSKHGIISSVKGPNGGFYLTRVNMSKPIIEIIHCIDGTDSLSSCILGLPKCSDAVPCSMHYKVLPWKRNIINSLSTTTISQAIEEATNNDYLN